MKYIHIILVALLAINVELVNSEEVGLSTDSRFTTDSTSKESSGLGDSSTDGTSTGISSQTTTILKTKEGKTTSYSDAPRSRWTTTQDNTAPESESGFGSTSTEVNSQTTSESGFGSTSTEELSSQTTTILKTKEGKTTSYSDVPRSRWTATENNTEAEAEAEVTSEIIQINTTSGLVSSGSDVLVTGDCKVNNIGVNSGEFVYYGAEMPLKDLAKMSTGWMRPWGSDLKDVKLDLDQNGYLKTVDSEGAQAIISDDFWGRAEDDRKYVLLYDGEGKLVFNLNKPTIIKDQPGRIEFELKEGRLGLVQLSTNPSNYLRNIRIIPLENEGNYNQEITRKKYRDVWAGVGVIRYLKPLRTSNSTEIVWGDRQKSTTFGAKRGQSIEDIVQMSNETNTSPWITVPHLANDDYFRKMAIYVRDNLNPNLKVHLEYTNETWNWVLAQTHYLADLAKENGTTHYQEYGMRAKQLFDIWGNVFGGNSRLVRVVGTQFYNPWISNQILATPGLEGSVDALAVGYYLGHEFGRKLETLDMTDDAIFNYLTTISVPEGKELLVKQKEIADKYNVELIAYEAGQHLSAVGELANNKLMVEKLVKLNDNPRMYQFHMDMYKNWNDIGGGLIVWFQTAATPSKWGSWGLLKNTNQAPQDAPKYQAFKTMLSNNGC